MPAAGSAWIPTLSRFGAVPDVTPVVGVEMPSEESVVAAAAV